MADRSKPPQIHPVQSVHIPQPQQYTLDNGIVVHDINIGNQDVIKIELTIQAGRWQETKPLVSRATAKLLKMGTTRRNADELANALEYYGTKLKISDGFDSTILQVYCLRKHVEPILELMTEMLTQPTFPESELEKFIKRNQERLKVDLQKGDFVSYRIFTELLYGTQHPYGYNSTMEIYSALTTNDLKDFFKRCYHANNCMLVVAGKTDEALRTLLNRYLGTLPQGEPVANITPPAMPAVQRFVQHETLDKSNMQASIRIGRRLFNKQHPDFIGFSVLNTVLGGYFGARLMQNLREDKGYTYGVYSSVDDLQHDGYFYIDTEVGRDVQADALAQIYHEIEQLRNEPIDAEELEMVRSYLMGTYLNALDGLFNVSTTLSDAIRSNVSASYLTDVIRATQTITAAELQQLAQRYLQPEMLTEVVVC